MNRRGIVVDQSKTRRGFIQDASQINPRRICDASQIVPASCAHARDRGSDRIGEDLRALLLKALRDRPTAKRPQRARPFRWSAPRIGLEP